MPGNPDDPPLRATYSRPTDLRVVLGPLRRGRADPTMRSDPDGGVWRGVLTPAGPGTLHLRSVVGGVDGTAWGPGASWLLDSLPQLLGADDDDEGFDSTLHPLVRDIWRRLGPRLRLLRTQTVWEVALPAILEQKVTGKQARTAFASLVRKLGAPAPGPRLGLYVAPPASVWARVPSWGWHAEDVDPKRARTVLAAAAVAPALERTLALGRGGPAVHDVLRQVRGIGAWTAAEITQRAHGDPDSPSVGDYHVAAAVGWALIGKPVDDDGMLELLEPWRGHRQRVVRLLELGGPAKPRFGPKLNPEDHRSR